MLLHRSGGHDPALDLRRQFGPEAVYLQRMLGWSAVVVTTFIGIELTINGYIVIGPFLIVLAVSCLVMLRSRGLACLRQATPRQSENMEERP